LQLTGTELDGIMKESSPIRTTLRLSKLNDEKELERIRNHIKSLEKQLAVARHKKSEMYECILQLSKLHDEEVL
jgi:hypothetical protein